MDTSPQVQCSPPDDLIRQISDSAEDIILIIDESRTIRFKVGRGKKSEGFCGCDGLVCGEIYEVLKEQVESVFESGRPCSNESRLPESDVWFHTRLTPIIDGSGTVCSVLGIARDVSEFKRKEKMMADSKAEWLRAIDAIPYLLAVVDRSFRIKRVNRAMADHIGTRVDDLHGRICYEAIGTKCPPEFCPLRNPLAGQGDPVDFQTTIAGRSYPVTISALADPSGNVTGCVFMARDVDGRSSTAETRKKNADEMKLLVGRAEYVMTIQEKNGKYILLRGLPGNVRLPESIRGKMPHDFFEADQADKICTRVEKVIGAGMDLTVSSELRLGKETFSFLNHMTPIRDETGAFSSVVTLSERIADGSENGEAIPDEPQNLTRREQQILELISSGLSANQIAEKLFISKKTVETHRARIMKKVGVRKTSALVRYAVKFGLF